MRYKSGSAFRQALDEHIRHLHLNKGIPIARIRKIIAFERFLARLVKINPDIWVLKGGLNMEIRLAQYARTTKDMDLLSLAEKDRIHNLLLEAGQMDLNDFFIFLVQKPQRETFDLNAGTRFNISSQLDGRPFEKFHVDIGVNDQLIEKPEWLEMPSYLDFAKIGGTIVPCYSINQQIAEKYHAMTRVYESGDSSRVKDLVDILSLASHTSLNFVKLKKAIILTFENRNTHKLPKAVSGISSDYQKQYSKLAKQVDLPFLSIDEANQALKKMLSPLLSSEKPLRWDQSQFRWK